MSFEGHTMEIQKVCGVNLSAVLRFKAIGLE